jgi:hypothetical protein
LKLYLEAELSELCDETLGFDVGGATVEMVGAKVAMFSAVLVVDGDEYGGCAAQITFFGPRLLRNLGLLSTVLGTRRFGASVQPGSRSLRDLPGPMRRLKDLRPVKMQYTL